MRAAHFSARPLAFFAFLVGSACATASPNDGIADQNLTAGQSDCEITNVQTGTKLEPKELAKLDDPVARLVLAGKGCPKTYAELQAKLGETDNKGCLDPFGNPHETGITTQLVSERAQVLGAPDTYRAVITRQCGGREKNEMFASVSGISGKGAELPGADRIEMIGKDKTSGVFNFYAREDGGWKFFGTSLDAVGAGYDCDDNGACTPKAASKMRCAGCHVGGGLVMKELVSPWVHWEHTSETSEVKTPGVDAVFAGPKALIGNRGEGSVLELLVESGNEAYVAKRVAFLKTKSVEELLRPLFCTVDLNLESIVGDVSLVALSSAFVHPVFDDVLFEGDAGPVLTEDYRALIKQLGQRVVDGGGKTLMKSSSPVTDTFFAFTTPRQGRLDQQHVERLVKGRIVDADFVSDVRSVDFTRPTFSKARCGLLAHAPKLAPDAMNPDAIRDGFKKNLAGDTSPAAKELLAGLEKPNDHATHVAKVKKLFRACAARPSKELVTDIMTYASHVRGAARRIKAANGLGIIEFAESMSVDDIPDSDKALDPVTCELK